ncbi:Plasma membrane sulfite pump involved in sulfite metabolism [Spiromyces aspiralis]|uniref:Plasma membrane sulfite pump involved in sulfite metabolism n=1 Tax=Spiromyces aspiralis TaxID=68401 RepID=A0ACC1HV63_9FUNG|nr:Plasma membrane sulfite pump involved in sulfite metabolism [Spiromyces aspiralis]
MTAAWLLPVVPAIVCAASGGLVSLSLDPDKAAVTILLSYVLWGIGVGLAAIVLVIYFQRLVLHSLPPAGVIVSAFLPLGPLGQGSYGIMKLGEASREVFPLVFPHHPLLGESFYGAGIFVGFIMWGFALWWAVLAISSVLNYMLIKRTMPFNIGWWGFTFPIGVYTSATLTLATYLDSTFLRILGTVYTVSLLLLWVMVMLLTLSHTWSGRLLYAPCLNSTFRTAKSQ